MRYSWRQIPVFLPKRPFLLYLRLPSQPQRSGQSFTRPSAARAKGSLSREKEAQGSSTRKRQASCTSEHRGASRSGEGFLVFSCARDGFLRACRSYSAFRGAAWLGGSFLNLRNGVHLGKNIRSITIFCDPVLACLKSPSRLSMSPHQT